MNESVYCVPADVLPAPREEVLALEPHLYELLLRDGSYRPRAAVETDEAWRQIIPYAVVTLGERVLLVERLRGGGERRLHDRLSIGLGGHINPVDHVNARDLLEGALARELAEELVIGAYRADAVGLIHSAASPVDRVHTGLLVHVRAAAEVTVRETTKLAGGLVGWPQVDAARERLEGWSQLAYDFLRP